MDEQFLDLFNIKSNRKTVEVGSILIAEPFMSEREFARTVILITENNAKGTVGLVLNHILQPRIPDLIEDLADMDLPIYKGGPVDKQHLFYIHTCAEISEAQKIADGIYFGGDFQEIIDKYRAGIITSDNIRMYAGYSGWSPRQLTQELNENTWMVGDITKEWLFGHSADQLWKEAMEALGERYKMWTNFPLNPILN